MSDPFVNIIAPAPIALVSPASGRSVAVCPVRLDVGKDQVRCRAPARFVVFEPNPGWDRRADVTLRVAEQSFGQADHVYQVVGRFSVLIWDKPLHL
jgi:hypothetical protein